MTEKSLNEALQTRNDDKNTAEERRKHRYKPLQFSKQGSSKTSNLFCNGIPLFGSMTLFTNTLSGLIFAWTKFRESRF